MKPSTAKRFSFMDVIVNLSTWIYFIYNEFNHCVFRMWKVKLSAEGDFLLFQAIADLLTSAGSTILN